MISFFKEKSASAVFSLTLVSFGIRLFFWQHHPVIKSNANDGLIHVVLSQLTVLPTIAVALLYHVIVILQALRLNYAINDLRMSPRQGYTAALAYVLLTALVPAWNNISPALVINSMVIWLLFRMFKMYNSPSPRSLVFNIGMITGCTIILYYASLPLILLAFIALAVFRPFRFNEWLILLLGILTPFYFLGGYLFMNDKLAIILSQLDVFDLQVIRPANLAINIVTFALAGLGIISGIYLWQANSGRMVIQVRKNWIILFFMIILFIPGVYLIKDAWPTSLLLAAPAAAAFVSNVWQYPKSNFVPALFFWALVAMIIVNNWIVTNF